MIIRYRKAGAILVLLLFPAFAYAASPAHSVSWANPPENVPLADHTVYVQAKVGAGSWSKVGDVPAADAKLAFTKTVAGGDVLCVRAKTIRLSDQMESPYSAESCKTIPFDPSAPITLEIK